MFNSELLPKGSANVSLKGATLVSLIPFPTDYKSLILRTGRP